MGLSNTQQKGPKLKSVAEIGDQRIQETFGGFGESTNIKRQREDYAI